MAFATAEPNTDAQAGAPTPPRVRALPGPGQAKASPFLARRGRLRRPEQCHGCAIALPWSHPNPSVRITRVPDPRGGGSE